MLCVWLSPLSRQDNHLSNTYPKDLAVRRGNHVHPTSSPRCLDLVASAETGCILALSVRPVLLELSFQRVIQLQQFCPLHIHKPCCISVAFSWRYNFCSSCRSSAYILIRWTPPSPVLKWTLSYYGGPSTLQRPSGANLAAVHFAHREPLSCLIFNLSFSSSYLGTQRFHH